MNLKTKLALTVSLTAYSSGDCVGGKISMPVTGNQPLLLQDITVIDLDNQKPALEILFFDADPAAGTYTDNGAITVHATDTPKIVARFPIAASDYVTTGTRAVATVTPGARVVIDRDGDGLLYALIATTSTPTFTTTASLTVKAGFVRA